MLKKYIENCSIKIKKIGKYNINYIANIGKAIFLLKKSLINKHNINKNQIIKNIYFIGVLSIGIILVSGFFIGMVVGLQGFNILKTFGAEQLSGQISAITIIRELGPVVSALLFAGRAGSSLTAEIGLMKSTEQISSMEMMGIDPLKTTIAPKFFAGILSMFFLNLIFIITAIIGSNIIIVFWLNVDNTIFWSNIKDTVSIKLDIINSLIKSIIFGFIIIWISVFQGINCNSNTKSIGTSTTNTVVYSSFFVLGLNFLLTTIMFSWK